MAMDAFLATYSSTLSHDLKKKESIDVFCGCQVEMVWPNTESVHQVLFLNFSQGLGTNSWTRVMTIREVGLMDASKREESFAGKMDTAIQHQGDRGVCEAHQ